MIRVSREAGRVLNETDTYREWAPPAAWRHAVSCCWEQHVVGVDRVQRVLPDGHADLLVHQSGLIEVVGLHDQVDLPVLASGTRIHGVRLRPAAVAAAFEASASSLTNRTVPADEVLGAKRSRRLAHRDGLDAWIRSVEPDSRTEAAIRLLASYSVDEVAHRLGVTARQLRRILLQDVGLSPKVYQRVVRLQRFIRDAERGSRLAAAAADAGYADQPHLTREVQRLAGIPPTRLLVERRASTAGTVPTA
jgi:AraC-like DNA-binding protein